MRVAILQGATVLDVLARETGISGLECYLRVFVCKRAGSGSLVDIGEYGHHLRCYWQKEKT